MKILYFSTVNWNWIKQRPQFICEGLAKNGHEVHYFSMTPLGKQKIKKSKIKIENLIIKDVYSVPFNNKISIFQFLNRKIFAKVIDINTYDVIYITNPLQIKNIEIEKLKTLNIIYDYMDNITAFYSRKRAQEVKKLEKLLCEISKHVITSSSKLREKIISTYKLDEKKVTIVRNALEKDFIVNANKDIGNTYFNIKKPCMMYVGTIEHWIDITLINKLLRNNPRWKLYMVGPFKKDIKKSVPSTKQIVWLGKKEHDEIASLIMRADIMIIPFKVNSLIECVDPVKIYEFIALQKIILSTYWKELDYFKNYKKLFFLEDELNIEHYLEKEQEVDLDDIEFFINNNNWENRVREYDYLMKDCKEIL